MCNVIVLTYWSFDDALIQTYTLPYIKIIQKNLGTGDLVYLLTLEKNDAWMRSKNVRQRKEQLANELIHWVPFRYRPFGLLSIVSWIFGLVRLFWLVTLRNIKIIHAWCTPAGAIGYVLTLLQNRVLILDSFEPHAEAMVENGTWHQRSIAFRLLNRLEKNQVHRADYVIAAVEGMFSYAQQRYRIKNKKFYVKPACVNLELFSSEFTKKLPLANELGIEQKVVCVYAGKFGGIYLDHEVFSFIKVAIGYWGDNFRFLLLTSHSKGEIQDYCEKAGVDRKFIIQRFVPHGEVPRYLALADFAITPVKPVPTKRYCTPIKNGEYWAMGLPVIIPEDISDDSDIIRDHDIGFVLSNFTYLEFENAVKKIDSILRGESVRSKIRAVAETYRNFEIAEKVYREVYGEIRNNYYRLNRSE